LLIGGTAFVLYAMRVKAAAAKHSVWAGVVGLMLILRQDGIEAGKLDKNGSSAFKDMSRGNSNDSLQALTVSEVRDYTWKQTTSAFAAAFLDCIVSVLELRECSGRGPVLCLCADPQIEFCLGD
jgi:hypothetical protein